MRTRLLEALFAERRFSANRYLISIPVNLVAIALTVWLQKSFDINLLSITFGANAFAAFYGGLGPGILVSVVNSILIGYFLVPPPDSFSFDRPETFLRFTIYLGTSLLVSSLSTALRDVYRQSEAAKKNALDANASKEEFLAIVAHDLKNPLHSISLTVDLMERSLVAGAPGALNYQVLSDHLERVRTATHQMSHLISVLVDAARVELSGLKLHPELISMPEVVSECLSIIGPMAAQKSLHLQIKYASRIPELIADRARIVQVLSNLLGNAVKHSPNGGVIEVQVEKEVGPFVVVTVADQGPGIPPEHQARIFERFWRSHARTEADHLGLGLYIAKEIVSRHQGELRVKSEPGRGSKFSFRLPIRGAGLGGNTRKPNAA